MPTLSTASGLSLLFTALIFSTFTLSHSNGMHLNYGEYYSVGGEYPVNFNGGGQRAGKLFFHSKTLLFRQRDKIQSKQISYYRIFAFKNLAKMAKFFNSTEKLSCR
jgi:hypothetical protein